MGFAFRPTEFEVAPSPLGRGDDASDREGALLEEIAFLRSFGVQDEVLLAAAKKGCHSGVAATEALLTDGGVSDTLFYYSLAHHLGLSFVWGPPLFAPETDSVIALRTGCARLSDGRWLIAPTGAALRVLLLAGRLGLTFPALGLTTPARFAAHLRDVRSEDLAAAASSALSDRASHLSARGAGLFSWPICFLATIGSLLSLATGLRGLADLAGVLFLAAMALHLFVSAVGLARTEPEPAVGDAEAPTYSVLVALHDEASIVPTLLENLGALDYPRAKLEILFLVEMHDRATRDALLAQALPPHMRVIGVPDGLPRTKPRALNVGLLHARGEFVTVYDAEDRPEPEQLRQAAARFARGPAALACLQARLAIAPSGLLSRLFAIEYAALFDVFNVGAARIKIPIALGGTSNHFRTSTLRKVGGWDAFNVTEDADLGLRLARFGYDVDDLPSTTIETADHCWATWFNQRRRWTKGWMQTALVLLRDGRAARDFGAVRSAGVALLLINLVVSPLLTPFALLFVVAHFVRFGLAGPQGSIELCEAILASSVLSLGVMGPLGCGYAGVRKRQLCGVWLLPAMIPYQLMISAAAWGGMVDLVRRPYHWHKTPHGAPVSRSLP